MSPDVPFHDSLSHAALDCVSEYVWIFDAHWRLIFANRAAWESENSLFPAREEREYVAGRTLWELLPAAQNANFRNECRRAAREGTTSRFTEFDTLRGQWIETTITPVEGGFTMVSRIIERPLTVPPSASSGQNTDGQNGTLSNSQNSQESSPLTESPASAKLRATHDTFRHLVEHSPFGIYVVDADFRLQQVSDGAQKVFETVHPLLGRDFADVLRCIWPEPFVSETIARFHHTLETGEPYHAPSTIEQRLDIGEVQSYDWKIERIMLPEGRFGVVCHFYDLSERRQAEEQLQRQAQLLNEAHDAIFAWEWEGGIVYWNQSAERLYGYSAAEALGKTPMELLNPPMELKGVSLLALQQENRWEGELLHTSKTGRRFWVASRHSRVVEPDGRVLVIEANRDITKHKQAEEALAKTAQSLSRERERLALALRAGQLGVYEWHVGEEQIWWSPEIYLVFGVDSASFVPTTATFNALIHPDDREELWRKTEECIARREVFTHEYRVVLPDGTVRWIANRSHVGLNTAGQVERITGVATNITERKQAEAALRDSEARLRAFYDNSPIFMGVTELGDSDVLHLYDNPATCRFFGTEPETTANKWALADLGGDATVVRVWIEHYRASEKKGEPVQFEHQYHTPEGTCWLSVTVCPIGKGIAGRTRFCYVAEDVTERKQVETALHESEERFRSTFEQVAVGIAHVALDGRWLRVNDRLCAITGYTRDELMQLTFSDITHPDDLDADWQLSRQLLGGEIANYALEKRYVCRDGSLVWVNLTVSLQRHNDGTPQHFISVIEDIRARKRAEQSLKFLAEASVLLNSSFDFQTTLENLARFCTPALCDCSVVYALSSEATHFAVTHVNVEKQRIAEELVKRFPPDLHNLYDMKENGEPLFFNEIDDALLRRASRSDEHFDILRSLTPRSAIIAPLRVQGRLTGVLMFAITERERRFDSFDSAFAEELARRASVALERARLFQEMHRAREVAEAANLAKDQFLSVVSHELRTPLTPILGWIEILRDGDEPELRSHALQVLERNARAQLHLVDDILDVSRISSGKMRFDMKNLELETVIRGAVDSLLPTAQAKKVRLTTMAQPDTYPMHGDAGRLQQVVWNLLSNALKFTPPNGEISLILRHVTENTDNGNWAEIEVRDSGAGIAPDFLPHVFERFRQADSSQTRYHGGLGLGLSIVKHIVDVHGGDIRAFSAGEGQGATFTVRLPLLAGVESVIPHSEELPHAVSGIQLNGVRVLVVDDEQDTCDFVQVALQRVGAQVRAKTSANEALAELILWQPDVLVCDINMPDMNGHQLLEKLRALPNPELATLPALALSASATDSDRRRSLECGFAQHLDKPLLPDTLIRAIAEVLKP